MKFKKGDQIKVTAGKDRAKTGKIESIDIKHGGVIVPGINTVTKHKRPVGQEKGGRVEVAQILEFGKFALICPKCGKETRIGFNLTPKGEKVRVCKKCGEQI